MRILGIDPGYAILGWGVIEKRGNRFISIDHGAIRTDKDLPMTRRLEIIYDMLREIIEDLQPEVAAIEKLFFNTNTTTAIKVSEARGVAQLACIKGGIHVYEYTPLEIKQALVGFGRADKKQVQFMVKTMMNLEEVPKPDDTADAIAAAICHGHCADRREFIR